MAPPAPTPTTPLRVPTASAGSANAPRAKVKPQSTLLWPLAFVGIFGLSFYSYTVVLNRRAKDDRDRLRRKESPSPL